MHALMLHVLRTGVPLPGQWATITKSIILLTHCLFHGLLPIKSLRLTLSHHSSSLILSFFRVGWRLEGRKGQAWRVGGWEGVGRLGRNTAGTRADSISIKNKSSLIEAQEGEGRGHAAGGGGRSGAGEWGRKRHARGGREAEAGQGPQAPIYISLSS